MEHVGAVKVVKIFESKRPGSASSGFVEFENEESVARAMNELNDRELNGKQLTLRQYRYVSPEEAQQRREQKSQSRQDNRAKTVFVTNIAFQLEESDLRDLFSEVGEVARVAIPLNDVGRKRGFAFVTFDNEESARRAIEQIHGREVGGRTINVVQQNQ